MVAESDVARVNEAYCRGGPMTQYKIHFRDERGVQDLELDDVQLEDGIYEFWRGDKAIERVPADQIEKVEPSPS
jgi:hypothetical protein